MKAKPGQGRTREGARCLGWWMHYPKPGGVKRLAPLPTKTGTPQTDYPLRNEPKGSSSSPLLDAAALISARASA